MKKAARDIHPMVIRTALHRSFALNPESFVRSCTGNDAAMIKDPPTNASDLYALAQSFIKFGKCLSTEKKKISAEIRKAANLAFLLRIIAIAAMIRTTPEIYANAGLMLKPAGHAGGRPTIKSFETMQRMASAMMPV